MVCNVIHIKNAPKGFTKNDGTPQGNYVYIGRPSVFGNPIYLKNEADRYDNIKQYRRYLYARIQNDPEFAKKVKALAGKTLVCFCKPKACHGDVLASAVARLQTDNTNTL